MLTADINERQGVSRERGTIIIHISTHTLKLCTAQPQVAQDTPHVHGTHATRVLTAEVPGAYGISRHPPGARAAAAGRAAARVSPRAPTPPRKSCRKSQSYLFIKYDILLYRERPDGVSVWRKAKGGFGKTQLKDGSYFTGELKAFYM